MVGIVINSVSIVIVGITVTNLRTYFRFAKHLMKLYESTTIKSSIWPNMSP